MTRDFDTMKSSLEELLADNDNRVETRTETTTELYGDYASVPASGHVTTHDDLGRIEWATAEQVHEAFTKDKSADRDYVLCDCGHYTFIGRPDHKSRRCDNCKEDVTHMMRLNEILNNVEQA